MLPATPEAGELQQLPLGLHRYLLMALREPGGHEAYTLLPAYAYMLRKRAPPNKRKKQSDLAIFGWTN